MKATIIVLMIISVILFMKFSVLKKQPGAEDSGIRFFHGTWQEALNKAQEENKLIFMDAYASWCGPCKMMSKRVFTSEKIGEYFNDHFINIKVDMEKGQGPELAEKYMVRAYPSLFFIDEQGEVKQYTVGYKNSRQLMSMAQEVVSKNE